MSGIVHNEINRGIHAVTLSHSGVEDIWITLWPEGAEDSVDIANRLERCLIKHGASVVKCDIFGMVGQYGDMLAELERVFDPVQFPVTWVQGENCFGGGIAGMQVRAVSGVPVETLFLDSSPVGRFFDDGSGKYCVLGNIQPGLPSAGNEDQAWNTLEVMEKALLKAGMNMQALVRTWFFNNRLLEWYREFNDVRTRFFKERDIFTGLLPASTGVEGKNPSGSALTACAEAVAIKDGKMKVREVKSPMQGPAQDYGSSFSRAVEIISADFRRVLISGTASIDLSGQTVFPNEIAAQTAYTMKTVDALLGSVGMGFKDVARAVAYVKNAGDAPAVKEILDSCNIPSLPLIISRNDICRDELLFEIEVDACKF